MTTRTLRLAVATAAALLLGIAGCGSDSGPSCNDGCNAIFACAAKINVSPASVGAPFSNVSQCIDQCNGCGNRGAVVNCVLGVQCPSSASGASAYSSKIDACGTQGGC